VTSNSFEAIHLGRSGLLPNENQRILNMRKRAAFTLVEMLVSMALILFIMVILSTAFSTGLQVFRQLKGLGDMEQRLRSASHILRRDLAAYHFEGPKKLSDATFWNYGPPQKGFFRIWQLPSTLEGVDGDSLPSYRASTHMLHFTSRLSGEGMEDYATSSVPAALNNLAFGDTRYQQDSQFRGRWYEVVYFLKPNGQITGSGGLPLYTLYRRQLGVLDLSNQVYPPYAKQLTSQVPPVTVSNGQDWAAFSELSCKKSGDISVLRGPVAGVYPDTIRFSSPGDLTMPARRFGMLPAPVGGSIEMAGLPTKPLLPATAIQVQSRSYPTLGEVPTLPSPWATPAALAAPYNGNPPSWQGNGDLQGADLLLSDVISFEVKILAATSSDFEEISPTVMKNSVFKNNVGVFDTWSSQKDEVYDYSNWNTPDTSTSLPLQATIQALKITIRLWDAKTQQARQVTIIQDM
jgi:type II secretory pathway pseudopilin PulG